VQRLQRISQRKLAAREPLPDLTGLGSRFGAYFRRGQTAMLAADPNNGKSPLALWHCVNWAQMGLRILYFSADTDEYTTWKRAAMAVTGQPKSIVEQLPKSKVSTALASLGGRLAFSFETDPTYKHLHQEVVAFFELWGTYPDVIVIDNLMDVIGDNEDEYSGMRDHTRAFKRLARATDSLVWILHHCNEEDQSKRRGALQPPARGRITGKVSQKAELVITIAYNAADRVMLLAPVKVRDGDPDDTGGTYLQLRSDPDRMQFFDMDHQRLGAAA
jgi:KaiC/GvpD/RAD55 family RecA-like ATPase